MKKPDTGKASPLRYLVFIHDNRMLAERAFYCFNLFRLPALSDILRFYDVTALPLSFSHRSSETAGRFVQLSDGTV